MGERVGVPALDAGHRLLIPLSLHRIPKRPLRDRGIIPQHSDGRVLTELLGVRKYRLEHRENRLELLAAPVGRECTVMGAGRGGGVSALEMK